MGSDDGLRVWINGTLVVDDHSHRALDPNSNSFRTVLRNGMNRMLVKVCQGEEGWEFSLKDTTREEHEAFLSTCGGIALSISSRSRFIGDDNDLTFSVLTNPTPLTDIPFSYSASDSMGNVIALGKGSMGEAITFPITANAVEYVNIEVTPEKTDDNLTKEELIQGKVNSLFFKGSPDTILSAYSAKARHAAEELTSSSSYSTPTFCPDAFVMTPHPFRDEWSGWFDRNWESLQGRS